MQNIYVKIGSKQQSKNIKLKINMKSIGTGLRRVSDQSQQRVECQVLELGKYREHKNKIQYQVFWDGYPATYQELQNLQGCKQHIKQIFTQGKTKAIKKRRPAFPTYLKRYASQSQYHSPKQITEDVIQLQSDQGENESKVEIMSQSLPSQEGELKIQYPNYNHLYVNPVYRQLQESFKHQNQQQQMGFVQNQVPFINLVSQESQSSEKKNSAYQNPTVYFSKTSQNQSEAGELLQISLSSEKLQNLNQIIIQKNDFSTSVSSEIHKQNEREIVTKKKVDDKLKQSVKELQKQKPKLKMKRGIINIKIPPIAKEEVFVTKSIRDGKKIIFEIMVYNKDGLLVPKNISYQDLVLKAPYALIKYYESKIIY